MKETTKTLHIWSEFVFYISQISYNWSYLKEYFEVASASRLCQVISASRLYQVISASIDYIK